MSCRVFLYTAVTPNAYFFELVHRVSRYIEWIHEQNDKDDYAWLNSDNEVLNDIPINYQWITSVEFKNESDAIVFKLRFGL